MAGAISAAQADALHAVLENVTLENAVVDILVPAARVHHDLSDDARARTVEFIEQLGVDSSTVSGLILHGNGRLILERLEDSDLVFEPGTFEMPSLPTIPVGTVAGPLNLMSLLAKYMRHVAGCEGTDFTDHRGGGGVEFTDDEWAMLQRVAALASS